MSSNKNFLKNIWFLNYSGSFLKPDIIAGITASAVIIPKAIAYSVIAGLPLQMGLYTAFIPLLLYALIGSSRNLSVTTTTTIALLTATALAAVAGNNATEAEMLGYAITFTFLIGAVLFAAGILRLGFLANFISLPVLTGFNAGIGVIIIVSQIPKLLGIHGGHDFIGNISAIIQGLNDIHMPTLIISAASFVLLFLLPKIFRNVPATLIVMVAAIIFSIFLKFDEINISLLGFIPSGIPEFKFPEFTNLSDLILPACGVALMSFTETITAGRAFLKPGEKQPKANRELFALGAANIGGSFFQSMPAGGGTSQTLVNTKAGAKTQMSSVVTVGMLALTVLFLSPYMSWIPNTVIAVILIEFSIGMIDISSFKKILKVRSTEFVWTLIAFAGVVFVGTLKGILLAILVSFFTILYQSNKPSLYLLGRKKDTQIFRPLHLHPKDETFEGLMILRTEGRILFSNAEVAKTQIEELYQANNPKIVLFDLSGVPDIEYTALDMLITGEKKYRENGIEIWFCALNERVLEIFKSSGFFDTLKTDKLFFDVNTGVEKYISMQSENKQIKT